MKKIIAISTASCKGEISKNSDELGQDEPIRVLGFDPQILTGVFLC
jgi:hypothetical protein